MLEIISFLSYEIETRYVSLKLLIMQKKNLSFCLIIDYLIHCHFFFFLFIYLFLVLCQINFSVAL